MTVYGIWLFAAWTCYVAFVFPTWPRQGFIFSKLIPELIRAGIFIAPILLLLRNAAPWTALRIVPVTKNDLMVGVLAGLVWGIGIILIAISLQQRSLSSVAKYQIWLTGFTISTVVEELTFRSYFFGALKRYGWWLAAIVSSLLFVLIHYPGWYFLGLLPSPIMWITNSVSLFLLGCVLALLSSKTTSIWPCVFVHACNNTAAALTAAT